MGILGRIYKDLGIGLYVMPEETKREGYIGLSTYYKNKPVVFVDTERSKWTKQLTAAHELAHILFGHLSGSFDSDIAEDEARTFSCVFTALMLYDEYRKDAEKCKK